MWQWRDFVLTREAYQVKNSELVLLVRLLETVAGSADDGSRSAWILAM